MRIVSRKKLREFWAVHADAEPSLTAWFRVTKLADWTSFADVRATYRTADQVGKFTVFNIGGNKYRLIATINFRWRMLYVRHVLTHAEYDADKWKDD